MEERRTVSFPSDGVAPKGLAGISQFFRKVRSRTTGKQDSCKGDTARNERLAENIPCPTSIKQHQTHND